jgi:hypothetical protein
MSYNKLFTVPSWKGNYPTLETGKKNKKKTHTKLMKPMFKPFIKNTKKLQKNIPILKKIKRKQLKTL